MKEVGIINRVIARAISEQGHGDLCMVVDAGFAIPKGLEVIDISLACNVPTVIDALIALEKYFSVEKMILAKQTKDSNPTFFHTVSKVWGDDLDIEIIDHSELKKMAQTVKFVIRTGDFTAFGNVVLVSGAGDRWYLENK
jgi:D-ribose pyranase